MRQIAVLDHLLDIVGDVGSQITAAQGELAHRHLRIPDIEQHHCLDVVDVVNAEPLQLQLDDLQELTMKALDERNHFEIRVVHCKPLVRPSFPRRWARRRLEREICRPVCMFMPGLRRDPSKKRPLPGSRSGLLASVSENRERSLWRKRSISSSSTSSTTESGR